MNIGELCFYANALYFILPGRVLMLALAVRVIHVSVPSMFCMLCTVSTVSEAPLRDSPAVW